MRAIASFDLDKFEPAPPYREEAGVRHNRARIEKTFHADIDGRGTVNGRSGGFSLLHIGTMGGNEQWARWPVVPGSGTGDLRTIRGEGRIDMDAERRHTLTLDYELD
jgi:hypothetical protein